MTLWSVAGRPKPRLREARQHPPVDPTLTGVTADLATYVRSLPSGPHLLIPGRHGWTDGSVKTGSKTAGAGVWFRTQHGLPPPSPITQTIGGEPVIIRGELGAIIVALKATPITTDLTLYTDSLSSLWIVRRWLRRDFGYCLDEEGHEDLVLQLVQELYKRRGAQTNLVWVPSHTGEPGNEVADVLAKAGVDGEHPVLDRQCMDIEFWSPTRNLINLLGWRVSTTRWANHQAWQHSATFQLNTSKAISTQSLLRPDRSRAALGKILQNRKRTLTERAVRRMLQARGFNTPERMRPPP